MWTVEEVSLPCAIPRECRYSMPCEGRRGGEGRGGKMGWGREGKINTY